ncbi:MAG: hypothetical protein Q8N91_00085 [Candidatus Omnitrophota bacterium]|nr:hypothetical protein [Candidatus Omnitrophota bacterium]
MRISRILTGLTICILIIAGLFIFADRMIHAQSPDSDPGISGKLDDILKNQKQIMQGIESIRSELNILKIRVTQQQ